MCRDYAGWWHDGILQKADAVDCVQRHAELWGTVVELGQDTVQAAMAEAFTPAPALPSDYAARLVRDFELADPRDRWRWTGEAPPLAPAAEPVKERPYRTPQATVDAFFYVVRNETPARLTAWLNDHPRDAAYLHKIWKDRHAAQ
ncbi:hypothetical protein I6F36_05785 [Bradyrhizobium sp. BRP19]|nr:hypothetical protein [Bradyrhizobium sp. BRP19]